MFEAALDSLMLKAEYTVLKPWVHQGQNVEPSRSGLSRNGEEPYGNLS